MVVVRTRIGKVICGLSLFVSVVGGSGCCSDIGGVMEKEGMDRLR